MFGYNEDDDEFERRLDDYERRRGPISRRGYGRGGDTGDDLLEDLLPILFGIVIAVGVVLAGAGWLDAHFGWGLRPMLEDLIHNAVSQDG